MSHRDNIDPDAGMGGFGMSFRYRPVPAFALDFGADLIGGIDFNGFERNGASPTVGDCTTKS